MNDDVHAVCEGCRKPVDPEDPALIRAAEVVRTASFQVGVEELEGMPVLFHAACFDEADPRYMRRAPPPR